MSNAASPGRSDRLRDAVALVLVLLGIALILLSNAGMHRLATQPIVLAHGEWAVARYEHFRRLGMLGYLATVAGLGAGIWSYTLHARRAAAGTTSSTASSTTSSTEL
ncbi:MAG: hypothetical protein ACHQTF_08070 [Gemmatimonadales bacterium]